jgi:hypothetical protein
MKDSSIFFNILFRKGRIPNQVRDDFAKWNRDAQPVSHAEDTQHLLRSGRLPKQVGDNYLGYFVSKITVSWINSFFAAVRTNNFFFILPNFRPEK